MQPRTKHLAATIVAIGLVASACGSDDNDAQATTPTAPVTIEAPTPDVTDAMTTDTTHSMTDTTDAMTDTTDADMSDIAPTTTDGASTLRAGLTSLLQEHVYLAGIAIETAVDAGGDLDEPSVQAAIAALDENSRRPLRGRRLALPAPRTATPSSASGASTSASSSTTPSARRPATRPRSTRPSPTSPATSRQPARSSRRSPAARSSGRRPGRRPRRAHHHPDRRDRRPRRRRARRVRQPADGRPAHVRRRAAACRPASSQRRPEMFPGDVTSAPAETRAVLTNLLQEHVYLAGIAIEQAVEAGGDLENPAVQAAVATLDANSVALSEVDRLGRRCRQRRGLPRPVARAHRLLRRLHPRRGHR